MFPEASAFSFVNCCRRKGINKHLKSQGFKVGDSLLSKNYLLKIYWPLLIRVRPLVRAFRLLGVCTPHFRNQSETGRQHENFSDLKILKNLYLSIFQNALFVCFHFI